MERFNRVALCGAPGAGKSAVLEHLKKMHNKQHHVAFVDEVATNILNTLPSLRPLSPAFFQGAVTACQSQIEEAILSEWKQNSLDHGLLIADRGVFDYFCYTTQEQEKYLDAHFTFKPYDLVLYLHGSYDVGQSGNEVRIESPVEIERLDKIGLDIWRRNVDYKYDLLEINYTSRLSDKVELVASAINEFFMNDYFCL